LRCTHGLDKIVLHSQDVLAAMKLQHDQMGEEFVKAIITHAVPLALLIPKGASSDPLAEKKDAILKDRDQYLDSREKLTEMTIKYHVTVPAPVAHVAQAPITGKETVTIRRGKLYNLPLSFEPNITPGRLTGHWESEGKSAHLRGANDDTIVAFTIRDSKNARVVQQLHTVSGKFDARYDGGVYTLTFSNADLLRSSARNITIEWTYQPD
ncbi:MAG TPA: hypothetical protein VFC46_15380, partial [Humisphaera sp.]|nr:hypothetical protein [Humisphaera sp.]